MSYCLLKEGRHITEEEKWKKQTKNIYKQLQQQQQQEQQQEQQQIKYGKHSNQIRQNMKMWKVPWNMEMLWKERTKDIQ